MNEFYQGLIAGLGMLGGLCAFTYWMFNLLEKRLEEKLSKISDDLSALVADLKEERRNQSKLYQFVLDGTKK